MTDLIEFDFDSVLDGIESAESSLSLTPDTDYTIDPRLTRLSYSGRGTLHSCPRRYQLEKISKIPRQREENVTLAFGTVVGIGIQYQLERRSWNDTVMAMLLAWSVPDLFATEDRVKKGFFEAIFAVQQFSTVRETALADYDLAYTPEGKPATEFSFRITVFDQFQYRGYIDAVLSHRETGKLLVLEVKTTGYSEIHESTYGNSSQATGYSVVLDTVAPGLSEYEVWYLVYKTGKQEFEILPFRKLHSDRATWIRELVMDCQRIEAYEAEQHYPAYGESCRNYGRDCEFYGTCKMSTAVLSLPYDPRNPAMQDRDEGNYMVELNLLDLIDTQLAKEEL